MCSLHKQARAALLRENLTLDLEWYRAAESGRGEPNRTASAPGISRDTALGAAEPTFGYQFGRYLADR